MRRLSHQALFAVGLCLQCLSSVLLARAEPQIEAESQEYLGRRIATTMHYLGAPWLVRESRGREEDTAKLLAALQIKPGQTVCDMGCGNGFYTLQLAKLVGPHGRVYAVDIQSEMLGLLRSRIEQEELSNVELVLGTESDPRLPAASIDLVLLVDVYHEFSHPAEMLTAIKKSLKPTGQIALAEFRGEDPEVPIKPLHKMTQAQILREYSQNDLELVREFKELPWQHLMFFQSSRESKRR